MSVNKTTLCPVNKTPFFSNGRDVSLTLKHMKTFQERLMYKLKRHHLNIFFSLFTKPANMFLFYCMVQSCVASCYAVSITVL